ncbi:MAG: hemerythrin domain-containing protein [Betaproteobacteria bacterium]|nr:hemerythrin domain-containing protein [Betaproteobacteria bacterium]
METISSYMSGDHHRCDELFAQAEAAASGQDWAAIATDLHAFLDSMHHHFKMEEEVLFPAFEQRTGMTMGPTQVMRMEHVQMRELFDAMADAVKQQDRDEFLGQAETLLVMMQQHNMKEEQMLYHMADQALAGETAETLQKMRAVGA